MYGRAFILWRRYGQFHVAERSSVSHFFPRLKMRGQQHLFRLCDGALHGSELFRHLNSTCSNIQSLLEEKLSATRYGAISVLSCLLLSSAVNAADTYDLANKAWAAQWISAPGELPQGYGVYHFRRSFQLPAKPDKFIVHVSGDNRYALYVNGSLASWGPARGDLSHWRYETVDIASLLTGEKTFWRLWFGTMANIRLLHKSPTRRASCCRPIHLKMRK